MDQNGTLRWVFPVIGPVWWTDTFGASRGGGERKHQGQDIFAKLGAFVISPMDGTVTGVSKQNAPTRLGGYWTKIRHQDGFETYFAHLLKSPRLRVGQMVKTGEIIGRVGKSGNAKNTKPHLHFTIKKDGQYINPKDILDTAEKKR